MKQMLINRLTSLIPLTIVINLNEYKKKPTKSFMELYYQLCDVVTKKTFEEALSKLVLTSEQMALVRDAEVKYEVTSLICKRIVIQ